MIPTASFNPSFRIWNCALTLPLSLKRRCLSEMIYAFTNIVFKIYQWDYTFIVIQLHCLCPQCTDEAERPGNDSGAHHKHLLHVCLDFCQIYLVDFLCSIITEVLLLRTCSLGFLLISELKKMFWFFFSVCFSTFSFHDLKKKKKK